MLSVLEPCNHEPSSEKNLIKSFRFPKPCSGEWASSLRRASVKSVSRAPLLKCWTPAAPSLSSRPGNVLLTRTEGWTDLGVSKNQGPHCRPQIVRLLSEGHPHKGPPMTGTATSGLRYNPLTTLDPLSPNDTQRRRRALPGCSAFRVNFEVNSFCVGMKTRGRGSAFKAHMSLSQTSSQ